MKNAFIVTLGFAFLMGCAPPPASPSKALRSVNSGSNNSTAGVPSGETPSTLPETPPPGEGTVIGETPSNTPGTDPVGEPVVSNPVEEPTPEKPKTSAPLSADLMKYSSSSTKRSQTPMGKWFETAYKVRATSKQTEFLENANQNVPLENKDWTWKTMNVKLFPSNGKPHPADGMQTAIGDCNMLALLNGFAYQHPDFLKSLITDKGNGTFEIKMFNPQAERIVVRVNSMFIVDKGGKIVQARGTGGGAIWLTVMEKAIMKYNHIFEIWAGNGPGKVEGFGSEAGAPMLTGNGDSFAFDRGALKNKENLTRAVKEALAAGKLITGGFGVVPTLSSGGNGVTGHAYTVMVPPNGNTFITMRNPWGTTPMAVGGSTDDHDGILDFTEKDAKWFSTIDLRIMEPGIAGITGNTSPYKPRANFVDAGFTAEDMEFQQEMHSIYGSR